MDSTQRARPAAIRFHFAGTLNVARQNRTNEKTSRIVVIITVYFLVEVAVAAVGESAL